MSGPIRPSATGFPAKSKSCHASMPCTSTRSPPSSTVPGRTLLLRSAFQSRDHVPCPTGLPIREFHCGLQNACAQTSVAAGAAGAGTESWSLMGIAVAVAVSGCSGEVTKNISVTFFSVVLTCELKASAPTTATLRHTLHNRIRRQLSRQVLITGCVIDIGIGGPLVAGRYTHHSGKELRESDRRLAREWRHMVAPQRNPKRPKPLPKPP